MIEVVRLILVVDQSSIDENRGAVRMGLESVLPF